MQQYRVISQLANAYVFKAGTQAVAKLYFDVLEQTRAGNFSGMGAIHTELACFKVFSSQIMH
jgi:hypothetical protein